MIRPNNNNNSTNVHRRSPALARLEEAIKDRVGTVLLASGLIACILIGGGAFRSASGEPTASDVTRVLRVATQRAIRSSGYEVTREFVGRVEARRESRLSLELGGLVTRVRFDEGDFIEQGDVVATLDTQVLESQRVSMAAQLQAAQSRLAEMISGPRQEVIEAARAEVRHWQAQNRLATITKDRNQRLQAQKAASRQQLDNSTYGELSVAAQLQAAQARLAELENGTRQEQITSQRAQVDQLQANLRTIDINLEKSRLIAPYSGIVSDRFIDEGTVLEAGTPVVQLLETESLDVRVGVSEDIVPQLDRGTTHQVAVNGRGYSATVRSSRPDRNQVTRSVSVLLTLETDGDLVHVGDLATVRIDERIDHPGFWLPISSLTESYRGLWGCYVAVPSQTSDALPTATHLLQLRELEVIHQNSSSAYVRGSLKNGEVVVNDGIQRLVPGQQVQLAAEVAASPDSALAINQ